MHSQPEAIGTCNALCLLCNSSMLQTGGAHGQPTEEVCRSALCEQCKPHVVRRVYRKAILPPHTHMQKGLSEPHPFFQYELVTLLESFLCKPYHPR